MMTAPNKADIAGPILDQKSWIFAAARQAQHQLHQREVPYSHSQIAAPLQCLEMQPYYRESILAANSS
jgi:hypothetical protein